MTKRLDRLAVLIAVASVALGAAGVISAIAQVVVSVAVVGWSLGRWQSEIAIHEGLRQRAISETSSMVDAVGHELAANDDLDDDAREQLQSMRAAALDFLRQAEQHRPLSERLRERLKR